MEKIETQPVQQHSADAATTSATGNCGGHKVKSSGFGAIKNLFIWIGKKISEVFGKMCSLFSRSATTTAPQRTETNGKTSSANAVENAPAETKRIKAGEIMLNAAKSLSDEKFKNYMSNFIERGLETCSDDQEPGSPESFRENRNTQASMEAISKLTVKTLEDTGLFEKDSCVSIFDYQIFSTQTSRDVPRADVVLNIVGVDHKYKPNDAASNRQILNSLKDVAQKKYPQDENQQKNFVLQCLRGIHKWGGQGYAFGSVHVVMKEEVIANSNEDTLLSVSNTNIPAQAKITVGENEVTFETSSVNCILDFTIDQKKECADLAIVDHSKFAVPIDANAEPGCFPHLLDEGNGLKFYKANFSEKKELLSMDAEPLHTVGQKNG
jgi:hypothetical protein